MKKIQFDNGVQEYRVNDRGVLRFNPTDPNLYARFLDMGQAISQIRTEGDPITAMGQADRELKAMLTRVFGGDNDFDKLLEGVNLLAMTNTGHRVIENLLAALTPVLQQGAQDYADAMTRQAVDEAQARRAQ